MSLKLMALAMASLGFGLALAAPQGTPSHPTMHITWRHDKTATTGASVAVDITLGKNVSLLQHQLCSSSIPTVINTGNFASMPIVLHVDVNGDGNITYGDKEYPITHVPEHGAPHCTRMYSSERAILSCNLSWASTSAPTTYPIDVHAPDCLTPATNNLFATSTIQYPNANASSPVSDTVPPQCSDINFTRLQGNGNPHQNAYDIQLSENINCAAAPSCTVGYTESKSFTIGASFTASCPWISGGFSVSETTTTGDSYSCSAGRGQTVCMWKNVAHTAYTVQRIYGTSCNPQHQDNIVIKSPNLNNNGGGFYCVVGTCRSQGSAYWDDRGP